MRWLRLAAVLAWAFEMATAWRSIDRRYMQGRIHCLPARDKRPTTETVLAFWGDCRHHSDHLVHNARIVFVVCTATTVAVLLLSWLPFKRWFRSF